MTLHPASGTHEHLRSVDVADPLMSPLTKLTGAMSEPEEEVEGVEATTPTSTASAEEESDAVSAIYASLLELFLMHLAVGSISFLAYNLFCVLGSSARADYQRQVQARRSRHALPTCA